MMPARRGVQLIPTVVAHDVPSLAIRARQVVAMSPRADIVAARHDVAASVVTMLIATAIQVTGPVRIATIVSVMVATIVTAIPVSTIMVAAIPILPAIAIMAAIVA